MRFYFIAAGASDHLEGQFLIQLDVFPVIPIFIPGEGGGQQPIPVPGREGVAPQTEIGFLETSRELVQQRFKLELTLGPRQAHDFSLFLGVIHQHGELGLVGSLRIGLVLEFGFKRSQHSPQALFVGERNGIQIIVSRGFTHNPLLHETIDRR